MTQTKHTFCRICEPLCPLLAEIDDDGAVVKLRPDREHPISKGFACHKGLSFLDVHDDPDRLDYPLRRMNDRSEPEGRFEQVSWQTALGEIGERLRAIRDAHGANALATYCGNPIGFSTRAYRRAMGLGNKLGTRHTFGAATQDMCNKPAALEAVFGTSQWSIPDFYDTKYLLCLGANPKISHWTTLSTPRPLQVLEDIVARGGKVRFVNPRRIESATDKTGDVVQIKPDTDVYFLAALLHEIDRRGGLDEDLLARRGKNVAGLRGFVSRYPPHRVAEVTGISAADISQIAQDIMSAESASFYMSTGVNQGRQGTLAYWLLNMLSFATGNLGRSGGNYHANGLGKAAASEPMTARHFDTPLGEMRHCFAALPGNLLADFIESDEEPIRALIVLSGNPLLSMSGEARLQEAFAKLDLIVCVDLYRNSTGELADYILPARDWLEREDMTHTSGSGQPNPYVQFTEAVARPKAERKDDGWIIAQLERELGFGSPDDDEAPFDHAQFDEMLGPVGLSVDALCRLPHNTAVLPQPRRDAFYDELVAWPDDRVDCCPHAFSDAVARCEEIFGEFEREDRHQLKLISLRTNYMHNGSLANMASLKRARHALNPLHMHIVDATRQGLANGDRVRVSNRNGSIATVIVIDDTLRPGVVAMSHGYGHGSAPGLSRAKASPGVNVNRLMPTGANSYEKLSNMSHMTGIPVDVAKIV